jgi:hypothetical protein
VLDVKNLSAGRWCEAKVTDCTYHKILVSFKGGDSQYADEWLHADKDLHRIAKRGTHTIKSVDSDEVDGKACTPDADVEMPSSGAPSGGADKLTFCRPDEGFTDVTPKSSLVRSTIASDIARIRSDSIPDDGETRRISAAMSAKTKEISRISRIADLSSATLGALVGATSDELLVVIDGMRQELDAVQRENVQLREASLSSEIKVEKLESQVRALEANLEALRSELKVEKSKRKDSVSSSLEASLLMIGDDGAAAPEPDLSDAWEEIS